MSSSLRNDGKHLHDLLSRTTCKKHNASENEPCYIIRPSIQTAVTYYFGACGARIKRGGFNGTISPQSVRAAPSFKKSNSRPRQNA